MGEGGCVDGGGCVYVEGVDSKGVCEENVSVWTETSRGRSCVRREGECGRSVTVRGLGVVDPGLPRPSWGDDSVSTSGSWRSREYPSGPGQGHPGGPPWE